MRNMKEFMSAKFDSYEELMEDLITFMAGKDMPEGYDYNKACVLYEFVFTAPVRVESAKNYVPEGIPKDFAKMLSEEDKQFAGVMTSVMNVMMHVDKDNESRKMTACQQVQQDLTPHIKFVMSKGQDSEKSMASVLLTCLTLAIKKIEDLKDKDVEKTEKELDMFKSVLGGSSDRQALEKLVKELLDK